MDAALSSQVPTRAQSVAPQAFFLPAEDDGSQRFCLFHAAYGSAPRGTVLYIHPFAEEMNKARRMAALQSRALAQAGYSVLQVDLLGCGDSSGDFSDAHWDAWVQDVVRGCNWLQHRHPGAPLWLWGLRAGCLLAVEAARRMEQPSNFLFWSPSVLGRAVLQQFLRLKVVESALAGAGKQAGDDMRRQLASGQSVDIAGYALSAGVATGLEQATLSPPPPPQAPGSGLVRLEWLDLASQVDATLSPAAQKTLAQWQQAGCAARGQVVAGPAFWQTSEIEDAPLLVQATTAALSLPPAPLEAPRT